MTFQQLIKQGIPTELPQTKPYETQINHAPKRKEILNEEEKLNILGGKFQDASIFYNSVEEINENDLKKWLQKSREIQWDYKNIVKRKGQLLRLK